MIRRGQFITNRIKSIAGCCTTGEKIEKGMDDQKLERRRWKERTTSR